MVWTPRFIISFALVLALGLGGATMLTNGMLNGYYAPGLVLLIWALACFGGLCVLALWTRSFWMRLGSVLGCFWCLLSGFTCVLTMLPLAAQSVTLLYAATATFCVLPGCYACLSVAHVPWRRWDQAFFCVVPVLALLIALLAFWLNPHSWSSLAFVLMVVVLVFSWAIWWVRPSCWRGHPGPALLLGLMPLALLSQVLPNGINSEPGFFFAQVAFLALLLATLRFLQCELVN